MAHDPTDRRRLGDVLVASGLLSQEQVAKALALGKERNSRLGETLVTEGILTQDQINWALAQHFHLSYVDVRQETLDPGFIRTLRAGLLYQHKVIPLVHIGDTITLAMADPTDSDAVLEVSDNTGCDIECAIASADAIVAALDRIFTPEERRLALAAEPTADEFARMAAHPVPRQRLGEILVDELLISDEQLQAALAAQSGSNKRLGEILIETGILTEDQINWALARHLDVPYIDLSPDMIDPELLGVVPFDFLEAHHVVPMMRVGSRVVIAMADPLDHGAIAEVAKATGCDVIASIAPSRSVERILNRIERDRRPSSSAAQALPIDLAIVGAATTEAPSEHETTKLKSLTDESIAAFKETVQHNGLPIEEKLKVYGALHAIAGARARGGIQAERAARQKAFAGLSPTSMKLALQLSNQVGAREVPVLKDEEFQAKHGRVGVFVEADRRFIVDRRAYDRTIREFSRKHDLGRIHVENAVMAARAYVATEGKKQILLISGGEKELAHALTKIIRIARTREHAAEAAAASPTPAPGYAGPERRAADTDLQAAMNATLAESAVAPDRRDKVIRAFRAIHQQLAGTFDRHKLKNLIREGIFVGFNGDEIALVERIMKIHGYDVS